MLREEMRRAPCAVSFSGGRDSSALLAIMLRLSRREGLPEPIAVTQRFPGDVDTEESTWQEMVVRHLRLKEWLRVDLNPVDAELLAPPMVASLKYYGLLWPPLIHLSSSWIPLPPGITVITGEGGDEILGPRRLTPLRQVIRLARHEPGRLKREMVAVVGTGVAPRSLRRRLVERRMSGSGELSWLQPGARQRALSVLAADEAAEPFLWRKALRMHPSARALVIGESNRAFIATERGFRFLHPFLESSVIDAIGRAGGPLGYAGRTDAMRKIFGPLLPEAILSRTSKARYNGVAVGPATRAFVERWQGAGVDTSIVNPEALLEAWRRPLVPAGTFGLIQAAWLAMEGLPFEGTRGKAPADGKTTTPGR